MFTDEVGSRGEADAEPDVETGGEAVGIPKTSTSGEDPNELGPPRDRSSIKSASVSAEGNAVGLR